MNLTPSERAEEFGFDLAYRHMINFLDERGTSCNLNEIYDHLGTVGIKEDLYPASHLHNGAWWRQFKKGVQRVSPRAWSSVQVRQYGPPLPLMIGAPLPRGHWAINPKFEWQADTISYREKEDNTAAAAIYDRLFEQFAAMELTKEEVRLGKRVGRRARFMQWLKRFFK